MRFLANENMPSDAVAAMRSAGMDVIWVREDAPGLGDEAILEWAVRDDRVLLSFDKDFGELAFRYGLPATCGIVLLRLPMPKSEEVGAAIAALVMARDDWVGSFSVIEPGRVRMRSLPATS